MKRPEHIEEARRIGAESFALLQYDQLPCNASAARQIEALKLDQCWQTLHHDEVSSRIDCLIAKIEAGAS